MLYGNLNFRQAASQELSDYLLRTPSPSFS